MNSYDIFCARKNGSALYYTNYACESRMLKKPDLIADIARITFYLLIIITIIYDYNYEV